MIRALLENNGKLSVREIAKAFANYDQSQLEYYESITHKMPGKVLSRHKIVTRAKDTYELNEFNRLTEAQLSELIHECDIKIDEYIKKRGEAIWQHRRRGRRAVPGTIRYEVLKRANYRCELCGISAEEKALEVDHITPKNWGGEDSLDNFQALCYTCNAQKKDLDDTDFRGSRLLFSDREEHCPFCNQSKLEVVEENILAICFKDAFPVTKGHLLIIPKRHLSDYFDLVQAEINAINALMLSGRDKLVKEDSSILGFNIGINNGGVAGQTIFHCHIHLIPRRKGDVTDPTGGIRNVIPHKGKY
jgi:diadenosine tetraphosphate (Ap4A) HIT family hydrolase